MAEPTTDTGVLVVFCAMGGGCGGAARPGNDVLNGTREPFFIDDECVGGLDAFATVSA